MSDIKHPVFTPEMKDTHTILIPTMLPMHFRIISNVLRSYGYKIDILSDDGPHVAQTGLRYTHNDMCYPAILVIGQFISALNSGKYDPDKVALLLSQTGGGCRASNYISLLRKALRDAGYPQIPVLSLNFSGLEKGGGFRMTLPILHRLMYGVLYGDLLMNLRNQCKPYEKELGSTELLCERWTERLAREMGQDGRVSYSKIKRNYRAITADFAALPCHPREGVRVGIVGEIFVKYSPLGNNNLEDFLLSEGAEPVVPGFLDFCLYTVYNKLIDRRFYGHDKVGAAIYNIALRMFLSKQKDLIAAIKDGGFNPPTPFMHTVELANGYISHGVKMGEGWLLTAEMLELIDSGVKNIVCTQPFGCLPNHIVGKGMMKPIKERNEGVNIVALDYDASATKINQENRIKLMLANAKNGG